MKVKICGITNQEIAELCEQNNCDYLGAVFYPKSPRFVEIENSRQIFKNIKKSKKVAVVVDPDHIYLNSIIDQFNPDLIQFHGQESIDFLKLFKKNFPYISIIKALPISSLQDQNKINYYQEFIDYFLFDNFQAGSGNTFNWHLLLQLNILKPWFLAGGISLANIDEAIKICNANLIDISSGLEIKRGIKDKKLVLDFLNKINILKNKNYN